MTVKFANELFFNTKKLKSGQSVIYTVVTKMAISLELGGHI